VAAMEHQEVFQQQLNIR